MQGGGGRGAPDHILLLDIEAPTGSCEGQSMGPWEIGGRRGSTVGVARGGGGDKKKKCYWMITTFRIFKLEKLRE